MTENKVPQHPPQWWYAFLLALAALMFLFRYDFHTSGGGPGAYRINRWTGSVVYYLGDQSREAFPAPPSR